MNRASAKQARKIRKKQFNSAIERSARVSRCLQPLAKLDLIEGSFVLFDIGVNRDGSRGHINVIDSNVPPKIQNCLRQAIDMVRLPTGPRATLRYRLAR